MTKEDRERDRTRMAIIETDIKYIKKTLDQFQKSTDATNLKMDSFIDSANKIYATKLELDSIRHSLDCHKRTSTEWIKTLIPWLISLVLLFITLYNFLGGFK